MPDDVSYTPEQRILKRLLALPDAVISAVAGAPPQLDGRTLDSSANLTLAFERWGLAGRSTHDVAERRAGLRRSCDLVMPAIDSARVENRAIPGPAGVIDIRVYSPHGPQTRTPVIVFYHGGGWVVGDLDTHDGSCRLLALHSGCTVVSVDYRLAPEHPFPAAVDDAVHAFRFVHDNIALFSGIPGAVAVAGDSAGGNLAAVVSLLARDDGPMPIAQILIYPAVDARMVSPSLDTFGEGFFLTKADMFWYRDNYLPDPETHEDIRVSPLLAEDLSGLPPTLLWTAGFDPLREEGEAYARRLKDAGVPVDYHCQDGQIHGFFGIGLTTDGMRTIAQLSRDAGRLIRKTMAQAAIAPE